MAPSASTAARGRSRTTSGWSVTTRECVVIDAPHDAAPILELVGDRRLTHVLLTHAHDDHVTVVADLLEAHPGAKVALHPDDRVLWDQTHPDFAPTRTSPTGTSCRSVTSSSTCCTRRVTRRARCCFHARDLGVVFTGDTLFPGGRARRAGRSRTSARSSSRSGAAADPAGGDRRAHRPRPVDDDRRGEARRRGVDPPRTLSRTGASRPRPRARPHGIRWLSPPLTHVVRALSGSGLLSDRRPATRPAGEPGAA